MKQLKIFFIILFSISMIYSASALQCGCANLDNNGASYNFIDSYDKAVLLKAINGIITPASRYDITGDSLVNNDDIACWNTQFGAYTPLAFSESCDLLDNNCNGQVDEGISIACSSTANCDDSKIHTIDTCNNAGTCSASCSYTQTNQAPIITTGNQNVNEGALLSFVVSATDADSDSLTYSASNLPTGASFTASTKTFSWTPSYTQSGNYQVTFSANDGYTTISKTINILILNVCLENWISKTSCESNDQILKSYTDSNSCGSSINLPIDNATYIGPCDYCTPSWTSGSWGVCTISDSQSRIVTDANNCYAQTGIASDLLGKPITSQSCDYCAPSWVLNSTWTACSVFDSQSKNYFDSNNCYAQSGLASDILGKPANINQLCNYCSPNPANTSWGAWSNVGVCLSNDSQKQSRSLTTYDANNCFSITGLASDIFINTTSVQTQNVACDYCTPNMVYADWSAWGDLELCKANDTKTQTRSRINYDANNCGEISNTTEIQTQSVSCNFCSPIQAWNNWASWTNNICQSGNMNQTRSRNDYDQNNCFSQTGLVSDAWSTSVQTQSQLIGPNYVNTSWSSWTNFGVCLSNDSQLQTRSLIQYDTLGCALNSTFTQSQYVACNYCSPSPLNTSWSNWNNGVCFSNDTKFDNRTRITYDVNNCFSQTGLASDIFTNITIISYNTTSCDYCVPAPLNTSWSSWSNNVCQSGKMNQTRILTRYDANNCYALTGLVSDVFTNTTFTQSQLIGPNYVNTSWSSWTNSGVCLSNDSRLQTRTLMQYDTLGCALNQTVTQTQYVACDYCAPSWTLNSTWTTCTATEIQYKNYYDSNNCYAQTNLASDLIGLPINQTQACSYDNDGDGFTEAQGDCNDASVLINPSAAELCDGIDNNCDASTDNGLIYPSSNLQLGVCSGAKKVCNGASGFAEPNYALIINYESPETSCDALDNDCDGVVDEGLKATYYRDLDADLFGTNGVLTQACTKPAGYVTINTDCDDASSSVNPNATEIFGDQIDQNCNTQEICYVDTDNDGYRTNNTMTSGDADCSDIGEALSSDPSGDCNDNVVSIHPAALELNDGINQNCVNDAPVLSNIGNKIVNENQTLTFTTPAVDTDGDTLTYSISNLPFGANYNNNSQSFSWTPNFTQSGNYNINFTANDGQLTDYEIVSVTVNNVCIENWTSNVNSCLSNDQRLISYTDSNACGTTASLPVNNGSYTSCDYCSPSWTLNSTWSACVLPGVQFANYYDQNNCYAQIGLASDLLGKPNDANNTCQYQEMKINFTFPKLAVYNGTEQCYYDKCFYDKTLSFSRNWFDFNITTDKNASSCRYELIEVKNDYTQNNYYGNMFGAENKFFVNITGLKDGLYNLTVYCNDSIELKTAMASTWATLNPVINPNYAEKNYSENDTDLIFIQALAPSIKNYDVYPNKYDQDMINLNFTIVGMKIYNSSLTPHYYSDLRINDTVNITDQTTFLGSVGGLTDKCTLKGIDENSTNVECEIYGYYLNSTNYNNFQYSHINFANSSKVDWYYYSIATRLITDAGYSYYNYSNWTKPGRTGIVDFKINTNDVAITDADKFNGSYELMMWDGMRAKHFFNFTNTGEVVNNYTVNVQHKYSGQINQLHFYDVEPGQTVYYERNFTVEANCSKANAPLSECKATDGAVRYYSWWVDVYPDSPNAGKFNNSYFELGSPNYYGMTLKNHVNVNVQPSSGSFASDYMRVNSQVTTNSLNPSWIKYSINWALDLDGSSGDGSIFVNNTVNESNPFESGYSYQFYPQEYQTYHCKNQSTCYIPGFDTLTTFNHYWNFKASSCPLTQPYQTRYIFNLTVGQYAGDQIKQSWIQYDYC